MIIMVCLNLQPTRGFMLLHDPIFFAPKK